MFMASNQFKIASGREGAFERIGAAQHARLRFAPGFIGLRFDRGPKMEGQTLYYRITIWRTEDDFLAWRISEQIHENVERARDTGRQWGGRSPLEEFEEKFSKDRLH
jgi:heme-degrading monooxygenase HmoA